jgi:hypothetical protein
MCLRRCLWLFLCLWLWARRNGAILTLSWRASKRRVSSISVTCSMLTTRHDISLNACEGVIVCIVCCIRAYISTRTHAHTHTHTNAQKILRILLVFSPSAEHAWSMLSSTTALCLGRYVLTCRIYIICRQLTRGGFVWASCLPRKAYVSPLCFFYF